jgi:mannose-6-phosphate isomerase-like protein (cupin superfamily)
MNKTRRNLLKTAGLSGLASLLPISQLMAMEPFDEEGFVLDADAHETYMIAGRQAPVTIIVDKKKKGINSVSFCIEEIFPNDIIPVHKHLNEVEVIYIQKGSGIFILGEKEYPVKEGSAAFVPKAVWHGLKNTGTENVTMMFSFAPSGFEGYFREIGVLKGQEWKGKTAEEFSAAAKKYGIVYKS